VVVEWEREADRARRIMHAAKSTARLPVGIDPGLMALRDRRPFASSAGEIAETAAQIRDANFRIEVAEDGIHVYNRGGHYVTQDALSVFPKLGIDHDAPHAFYLGAELAKAEIAWRLGKRYAQDEPLDWGCAVDPEPEDLTRLREAGHTLRGSKPEG